MGKAYKRSNGKIKVRMIIDSHQHFWKYNPVRDTWIDDSMQVIRRDFLPQDLKPILNKNNIDGCVAVQADQSENETQFLLDLANKNSFIKGVVGWVDLCAIHVEDRLSFFAKNKLFKGIRHILQAENNSFIESKSFQNGISKLARFELTYDILIHHLQLPSAIELVKKFPNQKFVLDHIAKPSIKTKEIKNWSKNISILADFPNVYCKVSGMATEADWEIWNYLDIKPYLDIVFSAFGNERILYGSDWPVCLLAAQYNKQLNIIEKYITQFSSADKALIMGENALKFYNLKL